MGDEQHLQPLFLPVSFTAPAVFRPFSIKTTPHRYDYSGTIILKMGHANNEQEAICTALSAVMRRRRTIRPARVQCSYSYPARFRPKPAGAVCNATLQIFCPGLPWFVLVCPPGLGRFVSWQGIMMEPIARKST